jgi:hypothetical protein
MRARFPVRRRESRASGWTTTIETMLVEPHARVRSSRRPPYPSGPIVGAPSRRRPGRRCCRFARHPVATEASTGLMRFVQLSSETSAPRRLPSGETGSDAFRAPPLGTLRAPISCLCTVRIPAEACRASAGRPTRPWAPVTIRSVADEIFPGAAGNEASEKSWRSIPGLMSVAGCAVAWRPTGP